MTRSLKISLAVLALLGVGAAVAVPLYTAYVEEQAKTFLRAGGGQSIAGTAEFDRVSADVFANTITVEGYRFTADGDIPIQSGGPETATLDDLSIRIERIEALLDTRFFLTPITGIATLQADGFESDWTTVPANGLPVETSYTVARIALRDAGLPPTDVAVDGGRLADLPPLIRSLRLGEAEWTDLRMESTDLPRPIALDAMRQTGLADGRMESISVHGISLTQDGRRIDLDRLAFRDLDLASIIALAAKTTRSEADPKRAEVFDAMGLSAIELNDLRVVDEGGSRTDIGSLVVDSFSHRDGIPTGLRIDATGVVQTVPADQVRQLLAAQRIPVALDIPDRVESRTEVIYAMDLEADRMSVAVSGHDSLTEVEMTLDLVLGGMRPIFDGMATGGAQRELQQTAALVDAKLVLEADRWDAPRMIDGRPSPRLFALQFLSNLPIKPVIDAALLTPVRGFLRSGGTFTLTMTPERPMTLRHFQLLDAIPPENALRRAGLSALHE